MYKNNIKNYWENLQKTLHTQFINFIFYLTNNLNWLWLDAFISAMCTLEVYLKLAKRKEFLEELQVCDICSGVDKEPTYKHNIPEHDLYCNGCPYWERSKLAWLFYGEQLQGYCYFLNNGDFSFGHATDLLWDGCKCCDINTDIDWENETYEYDIEPSSKE